MKIEIQESAKRDLKKIDKSTAIDILKKIKALEGYPVLSNIKKLKNYYPPFRYRIGSYRVLFDIDGETVIVVHIKHIEAKPMNEPYWSALVPTSSVGTRDFVRG